MKWVGQHIYDLVSRFRSDVYLEDISTGTIASGGNLGLDSNNKIVKATEASGDITAVTITTDSGGGSAASDTGGSADFSILGSSGVGVTNSGTTITAVSVPGEIDHDSLLNFVAAEHYAWALDISGTATIHTNNITDLHGAGVDGSSTSLLTDNGSGAISSEAYLTFRNSGNASTLNLLSNEDTGDRFTIGTTTHGATTLTTNDDDATAAHFEIAADGNITLDAAGDIALEAAGDIALEAAGNDLTLDADNFVFTSATTYTPSIYLINQTDDISGPTIYLQNQRGGEDNDYLGMIVFKGYNDAGTPELLNYATITSQIHDATDGEESGMLSLRVANHDGGLGSGLILTGGSVDGEVDVTVGLGAASVVTVPGHIDLAGSIDVDGTLEADAITVGGTALTSVCSPVAGHASIATVGTIGTGVWQGTAIAQAYIAGDAINGDKIADDAVDSEHYTDGSIDTAHIGDDQVTFAKASGVTPNVYGSVIKLIPSDFMANDHGGNTKFGVGYDEGGGGSGDTSYGMRVANNNTELYAFVSIPEGMKATHVDIYDKNDLAVEVFENQINATTLTSKGSGNANTTIDITDVNSTATNFLSIVVTTTSATNDKVYGGKVTIASI